MNQSYPISDQSDKREFAIEDFHRYTPSRKIALLEFISHVLFFADVKAAVGFGLDAAKRDYDRVREVLHSTWWAGKNYSMSASTFRIIRTDLELVGMFVKDGEKFQCGGKWDREAKKVKSRITSLLNPNLKALALLAREVMCALVKDIGWDAVDREHHWGGLAAIVRRITGLSLFSMDEEVQEVTAEERSVKRRIEFDRLSIELANAVGIDGYYDDVLAEMRRKLGRGLWTQSIVERGESAIIQAKKIELPPDD